MKLALYPLLFLTFHSSWCQDNSLKYEIQQIIINAPNDFHYIKGPMKEIVSRNDTIYFSKLGISGTKLNVVTCFQSDQKIINRFTCTIDSSTKKKETKVIQKWKEKIQNATDGSYKVEAFEQSFGKLTGGVSGYVFRNNETIITLFYTYIPTSESSISYFTIERK